MNNPTLIHVCAAVIRRNGNILLCSRPDGKHLEGMWEFPGGKVDAGETDDECLRREIKEELSLDVFVLDQIYRISHKYPDKEVDIRFYRTFASDANQKIVAMDNQQYKWVEVPDFKRLEIIPADWPFCEFLSKGL
ncbi:MAG: (deoxy)nucleoside triphosphate pyrophosphohydrolase [Victivallales bacterium]|jgi:8-oxo-dGTP diphosphatase